MKSALTPQASILTGRHRWLVLLPLLALPWLPLPAAGSAAASTEKPVEDITSKSGRFVFSMLPKSMQKNPRLDLNVITEVSPEGGKVRQPTASAPAYYFTIPGGYLRTGQAPPAGETSPLVEDLEEVMRDALATSHYLPAALPDRPPSIALVYHWGSHNNMAESGQTLANRLMIADAEADMKDGLGTPADRAIVAALGARSRRLTPPDENAAVFADDQMEFVLTDLAKRKDLLDRAALIGGVKFARELEKAIEEQVQFVNNAFVEMRPTPVGRPMMGPVNPVSDSIPTGPIMGDAVGMFSQPSSPMEIFRRRHPQVDHLVEESFASCYFVIASAYDGAEAAQGRRRLLWRTKMTVNADGVALRDTLPILVIAAGQYFGKEMEGAATVSRRLLKSGEVEIGTPTVVEFPTERRPAPRGKKR